MRKWIKVKCFYFCNEQSDYKKVLQVINPKSGKVVYIELPNHKIFNNIGKRGRPVTIFFDKNWKIKRIVKYVPKKMNKKQIAKVIKQLELLFKD